ncbi:MAG: hypothetical protein Q9201_003814 [Fulgogasparrea decipioides]
MAEQEYTRLNRKGKDSKTHTGRWIDPKKVIAPTPKNCNNSNHGTSATREDILPLQNFESASGSGNVEREMYHEEQEKETSGRLRFKPGLHIHGDLSTSRPGHFKEDREQKNKGKEL